MMSEPGHVIRSIGELLAVLHVMEQQAASRYTALAQQMEKRGAEDLAAIFRHLAEEEEGHIRQVAHWRESLTESAGTFPPDHTAPHEPFDPDELAELAGSATMTPYRALSLAVRGEERAVAFWSYVSAKAPSKAVKEAAEKVAHQELEHAALLRRERRRAYRLEQGERPRPAAAASPSVLLQQAMRLERSLLTAFEQLACKPGEAGAAGRDLAQVTHDLVAKLGTLIDRRGQASETEGLQESLRPPHEASPMAQVESVTEIYLNIAERSRDEGLVAAAQSLAQRAIERLVRLRDLSGTSSF
jgi:rubrerythrin